MPEVINLLDGGYDCCPKNQDPNKKEDVLVKMTKFFQLLYELHGKSWAKVATKYFKSKYVNMHDCEVTIDCREVLH